jgi:hypothetical protein
VNVSLNAAPLKPAAVIFTLTEICGKERGVHAKEIINGDMICLIEGPLGCFFPRASVFILFLSSPLGYLSQESLPTIAIFLPV